MPMISLRLRKALVVHPECKWKYLNMPTRTRKRGGTVVSLVDSNNDKLQKIIHMLANSTGISLPKICARRELVSKAP